MKQLKVFIVGVSLAFLIGACDAVSGLPVRTPAAVSYSLDLKPVGSGLDRFDSYQTETVLEFDGTRSGQPASGAITSRMAVDQQIGALETTLDIDGELPNVEATDGTSAFYRLGKKVYLEQSGEVIWFEPMPGTNITPTDVGFFDLSRLVVLPRTASSPSQTALFDGEPVTKIAFTEQDLSDPNMVFERAAGTVWVARPENIVRRYTLSATLRYVTPVPYAHVLDEGTIRLAYELTDLNSELEIRPPEGSRHSPLADLPRPTDAEIVAVYPTLLEYTSAISPVSATLFYRDELPPLEWTPVLTTVFEEKARLAFAKDEETATILINPYQDDKVKVVLSLD